MAVDPYGKTNIQPGFRLMDGSAINRLFSRVFQGGLNRQDSITATPGGTKAAAFHLFIRLLSSKTEQ